MSNEVGALMRHHRKDNRLTQKELAKLSGLAEITIRFYEAGKIRPKVEQLLKLAAALGVPIEEFLSLYAESESPEEAF